ncbi:MAG: PilZ domain-containing protein [Terriglobales bacterium]|jgi:PilZ domain-containing protein
MLTLILAELGMVAEHTPSVSRGLELLESRHFDAVILDYRADPSCDEFLARLRQSAKNRASLLIAVVDGDFNARPVFGLGANFVLYRPLSSSRTRMSLRAARGLMRRERRRAPRTLVSSRVAVAYPGAPEMNAFMADISDGGTLVDTANIPRACKVYFEFALPGQQQRVRLSGEVAWQDASGRTGIRFLDVPQSSRRLIQTWLQRNHAQTTSGVSAPAPSSNSCSTESGVDSEPKREPRIEPKEVLVSNAGNRRGEQRFACKLGADVYHLGSTVPNRCTLSDLSEGGCYVEMPTPFAQQSSVEILIRTADTKLRITGQVLTTHPGFGMGVRFMYRDSAAREEVLRLLAVLSAGSTLDEQPR